MIDNSVLSFSLHLWSVILPFFLCSDLMSTKLITLSRIKIIKAKHKGETNFHEIVGLLYFSME